MQAIGVDNTDGDVLLNSSQWEDILQSQSYSSQEQLHILVLWSTFDSQCLLLLTTGYISHG